MQSIGRCTAILLHKRLFLNFFLDTDNTEYTDFHGKPFKNLRFVRVFREIRVQKNNDLDLRNTLLGRYYDENR